MTLHDSTNNVNREHIVEVKEKEKKQTTSNCLKGKNRCKILEEKTIFEMEIILFMQLAQSFSFFQWQNCVNYNYLSQKFLTLQSRNCVELLCLTLYLLLSLLPSNYPIT